MNVAQKITALYAQQKEPEQMFLAPVLRRRIPTVLYQLDSEPRQFSQKKTTKTTNEK